MNDFTYCVPTKIVLGKGTVPSIGKELSSRGIKKVLLVTYGESAPHLNGVYQQVIDSVKENDVDYFELLDIQPNPLLSKAQEGIDQVRANGIDAVLAIGGGSVIDTAKCVAIGAVYNGDVWDFYEKVAVVEKALPIFVVCTISGTGSESNGNSVIKNVELGKKFLLVSQYQYPVVTIIDPELQYGLPMAGFVSCVIDATSHVVEHYFDGAKSLEISDALAEAVLRTLIKSAPKVLRNPKDYEARVDIIWAASLALNGVPSIVGLGGNGGDWGPHGLEKGLSILKNSPHGQGLGILLPAWMKYVYKSDIPKFVRFAKNIWGITEGTDEEKALAGIAALQKFYAELDAPLTLREVGVTRDEFDEIVKTICLLTPLSKIQKLNDEDIPKILELAY